MKTLAMLGILLVLSWLSAKAQTTDFSGEEKKHSELLFGFYQYVQQTPEKKMNKKRLQSYIHLSDSAWVVGSEQNRILQAALKNLSQTLQGADLSQCSAVPWLNFPRQDTLPKMV